MKTVVQQQFQEKITAMRKELKEKITRERIDWLCSHCLEPFEYKNAGLFELHWLLSEAAIRTYWWKGKTANAEK